MGVYSDFERIAVISVPPGNWETRAIEPVTDMPFAPDPNQPLTKINHPDPEPPDGAFIVLGNVVVISRKSKSHPVGANR